MKVTVCRPDELGEQQTQLWQEWQRVDPALANPFLTPEFAAAYARHQPAARVAVVEEGGAVTAFFPFEQRRLGVARGLAYRLADCQGVVCAPNHFPPVRELLKQTGLAAFEFDHVVATQAVRFAPRAMLLPSPIVDLRGGWPAFLAAKKRSGGRVERTLVKGRKLARELGPLTFQYDSQEHCELDRLIVWKRAQYARTGRRDVLAWPWMRNLLHELLDTRDEHFSMRLSRLAAGDRTAALYLCARSGGVLSCWLPAYDVDLARYSPGLVSALSLLEAADADGIHKFDMGKGHDDYKQSLKTGDDLVGQGVCERPVPAALWRRVHQAPRQAAFGLVNKSPRAYRAADRALRSAARVRAGLRGA